MTQFSYILSLRFHALCILAIIGIVATFSSADTFLAFAVSKIIGIISLAACYALGSHWYHAGRMPWIDTLLNQEEE